MDGSNGALISAAWAMLPGDGVFVLDPEGNYVAFNEVHSAAIRSHVGRQPKVGEVLLDVLVGPDPDAPGPSALRAAVHRALIMARHGRASTARLGTLVRGFREITFTPLPSDEGIPQAHGILGRHPPLGTDRLTAARDITPDPSPRLADGVLNELNNLGVGLSGAIEAVRTDLSSSTSALELLEELRDRIERARRLGRTIRSQSKPAPTQVVDLDELLVTLEAKLRSVLTGINLVFERGLGGVRVQADPSEIKDALTELLVNAKEADAKMVVVRTGFDDGGQGPNPAGSVVLEVEDDGEGIETDRLPRVFEPYTGARKHGQGLGLTRVRSIVHNHGGSVQIRSERERGTTLRVKLPALADLQDTLDLAEATPLREKRLLQILVVDDAPEVRRVLGRVLRHEGHEVTEAEDGVDALEKLNARSDLPDLIVLDLMMPRMDGVETYRALRAQSERLPILITSGYHPSSLGFLTTDPNARFLPKPFSPSEVLAALQQLIKG